MSAEPLEGQKSPDKDNGLKADGGSGTAPTDGNNEVKAVDVVPDDAPAEKEVSVERERQGKEKKKKVLAS